MNEKLKAFLDEKKATAKKKEEKKKNELLIELGLFEKVYSEENEQSAEFPYYDYEDNRWFKRVPITVSDEEYEELKKYAKPQNEEETKNGVASLLKGLAVVVYICGFISGFVIGMDSYGNPSFLIMLICWITGFFSGSLLFGFAEVIKLLNDIKNK